MSGLDSGGGGTTAAGEREGRVVSMRNGEVEEEGCIAKEWAYPCQQSSQEC